MQENQSVATGGPPIHYLAALLTLIMDWIWGTAEGGATLTGVGILAVPLLMLATGGTAFMGTLLIQKFVAADGWGKSFTKAFVMGIIAGLPFMVAGTAVGGVLLGWAGLSGLGIIKGSANQTPPQLPPQKPPQS